MQIYKTLPFLAFFSVMVCGCATQRQQTTLRIHEQVNPDIPGNRTLPVEVPLSGLKLSVSTFATLSERDIQSAEVYETAGGAAIMLRFDPHGMVALDEMTTRTRGQYVVIFLNTKPVAAWLVDKRLTTGQFLLEGDFTDEEARQTVDALNRMGKKRK